MLNHIYPPPLPSISKSINMSLNLYVYPFIVVKIVATITI